MPSRDVDDLDAILEMAGILSEIGYRDLAKDGTRQRVAVARRLWRQGIDQRLLRLLWSYAQECGQSPVRLFCWWMDRPSRAVAKVDELRESSEWTRRVLHRMQAAENDNRRPQPAPVYRLDQFRKGS